jgi:formiminotetrahydrofolate cyclodeaminase
MSAAMVEMACNLTVGRDKFRDVEADLTVVLNRARELRETLLEAVDQDTEAYDQVSQAYKLPRSTDAEKAERAAAIQAGLQYATEVPLRVAQASHEIYQLATIAIEKSNPNVASDAKVAQLLADAARDGAIANVNINLGSITDGNFVERMQAELQAF